MRIEACRVASDSAHLWLSSLEKVIWGALQCIASLGDYTQVDMFLQYLSGWIAD